MNSGSNRIQNRSKMGSSTEIKIVDALNECSNESTGLKYKIFNRSKLEWLKLVQPMDSYNFQ